MAVMIGPRRSKGGLPAAVKPNGPVARIPAGPREECAMNCVLRYAPAALLLLSVPRLSGADEWKHEYAMDGRPSVVLRGTDAHIQVETWEQSRVAVRVTTVGWQIRPGEVRVLDGSAGNRVAIEVREPTVHFSLGWEHRRIMIDVMVPAGTDLDAQTSDGAIELPALQGTVRARTSDGAITLERAKGTFDLSSSDGRIVAHGVDGALDARSSDGALTVDGRFDVLRLSTSDGRIEADVASGSRLRADWSFKTSDGSIDLRLPSDLAADLEAHVGDGHIDVDFPITTRGRIGSHDLRATLNGGGPLLSLRTSDGSIRIAH
jgi:putative adhesin